MSAAPPMPPDDSEVEVTLRVRGFQTADEALAWLLDMLRRHGLEEAVEGVVDRPHLEVVRDDGGDG